MNEQKKSPLPEFAGMVKADIVKEIDQYRLAGVSIPQSDEELMALKKPDLVQVAQDLMDANGVVFIIDEKYVEANPDTDNKVGEYGLLPLDMFETVEETEARRDQEEVDRKSNDEDSQRQQNEDDAAGDSSTVPALKKRYSYNGREVISVTDKLMNGRLYKEVYANGETFLLTEAEFADVKEV